MDRRNFLKGMAVAAVSAFAVSTDMPVAEAKVAAQETVEQVFDNAIHLRMTHGNRSVDVAGNLTRATIDIRHEYLSTATLRDGTMWRRDLDQQYGEVTITIPLEDVRVTYAEAKHGKV